MADKNEFEFELNGDKVYTGCQVPETMPLSFQPYPETMLRPLGEIAEIIKNPERKTSRERWGQEKLINQGRRSSCNAFAAAALWMRIAFLATGKWIRVSPEHLYMRINGGRDAGSMLDDGMVEGTDNGFCKYEIDGEKLIPDGAYRTRDIPMEQMRVANEDAKEQRFGECYQFPKDSVEKCFHALLSCIAGRGGSVVAVHVGRNYMRSGVVAGFDSGSGNHAVAVDDIVCLNDNPKSIEDFRVVSPQSWGLNFADKGWTQLTYKHISQTMRYHGLYGVRTVAMSEETFSNTRIR